MTSLAGGTATAPPELEPDGPPQRADRLSLKERMPSDGALGWALPAIIAVLAGVVRFIRLGDPKAFVFDETYYAKDAWSLLQHGHERSFVEDANERILAGNLDGIFATEPSFIAHPPAGKWVIAAGEYVLGLNPWGWRVMVALLGTLSVLMIARIARRLFRSTLLGCLAGLLLALDGMHFVHSRTALLDLILMFFVLAAFGCLLLDRDWARTRLAGRLAAGADKGQSGRPWVGPGTGLRPWLWAAGILLGLACATKWSGIPFVVVFGLLTVAWDVGARRRLGARNPLLGMLTRDGVFAFVSVVGWALVAYVASWSRWLIGSGGYARENTAAELPEGPLGLGALFELLPGPLLALVDYHVQMWGFNSGLRDPHPYASNPWSWLVMGRPVSFYYEGPTLGEQGCEVENCSQAILAVGTPAIWWAGILAILVVAFCWLLRRDWRAGAIMAGLIAGYLPWFTFQERTIYSFYSIVFLPWVVLALVYCLGLILGPRSASPNRRAVGAAVVCAYVLLVLTNFAVLYPVLANVVIPYESWAWRMMFDSWI